MFTWAVPTVLQKVRRHNGRNTILCNHEWTLKNTNGNELLERPTRDGSESLDCEPTPSAQILSGAGSMRVNLCPLVVFFSIDTAKGLPIGRIHWRSRRSSNMKIRRIGSLSCWRR